MTMERAERADESPSAEARTERDWRLQWGSTLLGLIGLTFVAQGLGSVYRSLFSDRFEPGVDVLDGATSSQLAAQNPELASYVSHLQINGGTLAALVGVAMLVLVWYGVRRGHLWAWTTTVALPLVYLSVLVPLHLASGFDYHVLEHLGAVAVGVPVVVAGAVLAYQGLQTGDAGRPSAPQGGS